MRISDWSSDVCSSDLLDQAAALGLPRKTLNPDAVNRLMAHPWPGNVRELENLMRRLAALSREEAITAGAVEQGLLEGVEDKESLGQTAGRSEERRVGQECVRTCRSRVSPSH